jgi:hypothetical protein
MYSRFLLHSVFACCATTLFAQAPLNDNCAGAIPLVLGANVGTTVGATAEGPACGAGFLATTNDVFYSYTPAVDEACSLFVTSGTGVDKAAAFSGACGALAPVSCTNITIVSPTVPLAWYAQAGVTYTIRLGRTGALGAYTVTFSTAAPLANDQCSSPTVLADGVNPAPGASGTIFTNVGATSSSNTANVCAAGGFLGAVSFDVWFQYTASVNGPTLIQTCTPFGFAAGTFDGAGLQAYVGSCGALTEVACNLGACTTPNGNSLVSLNASAGTTYTIRVSGSAPGAASSAGQGTFYLTVSPPVPPPANDECSGAAPLAVGPNAGTTAGALVSADPVGACALFTGTTTDVWYAFTAAAPCTAVVTLAGTGADRLGVYSGACGALVSKVCGVFSAVASVAAGTYYVRVGQSSALFAGAFSLNFQCLPPLANDDCLGAAAAVLGDNVGSTVGATVSPEAAGACSASFGTTAFDVWYAFTPATNGNLSASVVGVGANAIAVYDASTGCGGPSLNCGSAGIGVTGGFPLLIRVGQTTLANQGAFTLKLNLIVNDDCSGALALNLGVNGPFSSVGAALFNDVGFSTPSFFPPGPVPPGPALSNCYLSPGGGGDLFYTYTSDCDAAVTVTTCDGDGVTSPFELEDTQITVYDVWTCGVAGANHLIACGDNDGSTSACGPSGLQSTANFSVVAGQTVLVRVAGRNVFSSQGVYTLRVTRTAARFATIGAGCGAGATPTLSGSGPPVFGATVAVTAQAQPAAFGALLGSEANVAGVYAPYGPCTIYLLQPGLLFLAPIGTDLAGQWTLSTALPPYDPALDCYGIDLQAVVVGPAGTEFTNALRLVLGT